MMKKDCIFCKIANKEMPASFVYEDEKALAFLDIKPLSMGHTLVIPRNHYETILDITEEEIAHLSKIIKRVALAARKGADADGITILQQNGRAAGQEIFHMHVHVIPRHAGKTLAKFGEAPEVNRKKLDEIAERIRKQINYP